MQNLRSKIDISTPTKAQLKHDAWLTVAAFIGSFVTAWQVQPDKISRAALVAGISAGISAAVTVIKSIVTTL